MTSAASWWSYAEGNAAVLGFVVCLIVLAALGFVGVRIVEERKRRRR